MAINKEQFSQAARTRIKDTKSFWANWRTCARDDYDFVAGQQWSEADTAQLREEERPTVTFNYSEKMVDAIVGAEINNRQEAAYKPRGVEDAALAELWNNAASWAREECDCEDEESDAFRDMLICGIGWTQTRMSYDEDQDGKILIERIDPLEMYADPAASKSSLTDRRFQFRQWWVDEAEAKREWPGDFHFPTVDSSDSAGGVITLGHRYNDSEKDEATRHKDQVLICHYEAVEKEPIYRVALADGIKELSVPEFNAIRDQLDDASISYIKQYKFVYYRAFFAGETLLEFSLSPCQVGFTFQCITGKRDRNKNVWYGLTRVMKDPQRWANKWLSQIMYIINSNAKGGLLAEAGAFVDPVAAQEEWAKPDSITLLNEGAIGKVVQKQQAPYPAGLDKLMEFALGSLPMVTGINLEALGLANRDQPGVLEAQRKQAAFGLLAPLFNALRRYRKNQGRILLYYIHEFISDGRLIRIGGPEAIQFLPLTKQPDAPRYDIIVDQSPNAPDVKDRTWETLMQLIPSLMKAGIPVPPDLLDFAPIPSALAVKWKMFIAQSKAQQVPPQIQQQMQQMQQQLQKLSEENTTLKQDQQIEAMTLKQQEHKIGAELTLKKQAQDADLALQEQLQTVELELERDKVTSEFKLAEYKVERELILKKQQIEADTEIKRLTAKANPPQSGP